MVAMYPNVLNSSIYEALAASRGEPTTSYLMSQESDYNKGLTWDDAVTYVNNIAYENMLVHVPILSNLDTNSEMSAKPSATKALPDVQSVRDPHLC